MPCWVAAAAIRPEGVNTRMLLGRMCVQAPAVMDSDTKKLIRAVVRRVHPDLFTAHPFERQRNSDSLKVGGRNTRAAAAAADGWQ